MNFYNEIDPYAAQWLRNLISAKLIPQGVVDERSIEVVEPDDLAGFSQCHFFAGIGGWPYALQLAGWPEDRPIWTGSCPCQPFSVAGKGEGVNDKRHLWPQFNRLISARKPPVVAGEQVASAAGRDWLTGVRSDLEALGYEVGAADLCAAGVGAPHIRQRLWWLADSQREGLEGSTGSRSNGAGELRGEFSEIGGLGYTDDKGPQGRGIDLGEHPDKRTAWSPSEFVYCTDGKTRRFEPGSFPLVDGATQRVGRLRAYGNCIVPQVAAEVIKAYMDVRP